MGWLAVIDPLYALSGFLVGFVVGLTGVGGGSLMTPLLILLFNVNPAVAVGTDLLFAACTKVAGSLVHGYNQAVDWRVVGLLGAGSVPASIVTIIVLSWIGLGDGRSSPLIRDMLGVMLILTSVATIFRQSIVRFLHFGREIPPRLQSVLTVLFGAVLGLLVTISSVGAGAIGVTVLMLLHPRMPTLRVVGSDIAHAVPLTLVAGIGHWTLGSTDMSLLLSLLTGSIPGVIIASFLSPRFHDRLLRLLLSAVLMIVGARLLFG